MPRTKSSAKSAEYSYDIYDRPLSAVELKTLGEVAVWNDYIRGRENGDGQAALQELLRRHDNCCQYCAARVHYSNSISSEVDDKLQHARIGAMRAYDKFDYERARTEGVRLSTYLQNVVYRYLLDIQNEEQFISCPNSKRMARGYIQGRYDSDKVRLAEVEKQLGIRTSEDRQVLMRELSTLNPSYHSIHDPYNHAFDSMLPEDFILADTKSEDDFISEANIWSYMERSLSERQQDVLVAVSNNWKLTEIARELGIDTRVVQSELKKARKLMMQSGLAEHVM